jgi:succinoglycan biosynthesis transport protein ExoP
MPENEFDYKKYLEMIYKKKVPFIIVALGIMAFAVVLSFCLPRKYEAKSTIFIENSLLSQLVSGMALSPSIDNELKVLNSAITSRNVLLKVFNDLNLKVSGKDPVSLDNTISAFKSSTKIDIGGSGDGNGMFVVSFTGVNPKFVADYINSLVKAYIQETVSVKRKASSGASSFFSSEIQQYRDQFNKAEEALNAYKSSHAEVISNDEGSLMREISDLSQKLDTLRVKRVQLDELRSLSKRGNPLRDKLYSLQRKLSDLQVQYTDSYPEVIKTKEEIEEVNAQLRSGAGAKVPVADPREIGKLDIELRGVNAEEASLRRLLASKQSLFYGIPAAKAKLAELERDRNAKQALYQELVDRQKKSEFTNEMEVQEKAMTFRVIEPAFPPTKPISPNRIRIMFLGILAGLGGGLGLVLLLDFMDNSVKDVSTLKTLGLPILGAIPRIENEEVTQLKKANDVRIFTIAGCFFSVILAILLMEALNLPYLDNIVDKVQSFNFLADIKSSIKSIF